MVAQRAEELVARLRTGDSSSKMAALKAVRNQVIGNKQRKRAYLQLDVCSTLVELLASGAEGDLAVQCATVAGSLARESAGALLRAGGIMLLLGLLDSRDEAVVEAGLRALNFYFEGCVADKAHQAPPGLAKALALLASGNPGIAAAAARLVQHCARFPHLKACLQEAGAADALLPLVEGEQPEAVVAAAVPALLRFLQPPAAWRPVLADRLLQRMRAHAKPDARLACAACLVTATQEQGEPLAQDARRQCLAALARLVLEGSCPGAGASPLAVLRRLLDGDASLQAPARDCGVLQALPRRLLLAEKQAGDVGQLLHLAAGLMKDSEDSRRLFVESAGDDGLAATTRLLACETAPADTRLGAAGCLLALSRSAAYLRQLRATFAACIGPCLQLLAEPQPAAPSMPAAAASLLANVCLNFSPAREAVVQSGGIDRLAAAAEVDGAAAPGPAADCALLALANLARQSRQEERAAVMAALPGGGKLLALAGDADRRLPARVAAMTLLQNLAADASRAQAAALLAWAELDCAGLHRLLPPPDAWQAVPAELLVAALALVNNLLACGGEAMLAGAAGAALGAQLAALLDHDCGRVVVSALFVIKSLMHEQGDSAAARLALLQRAGVWPKVERLESDFERLDVGERALSLLTYRLSLGSRSARMQVDG